MTQTSYPLVGAALTGAQWRVIQDVGDGVVNDLTGGSYAFAVTGADSGTVGLGQYRIDGVLHEISVAESVTLAAVSSPTTYLIGLKVDFALENTVGQIALVSGVKATLLAALTGAQHIVPLFEVDRTASTILSASVVRDLRAWTGDHLMAASVSAAPEDAPIGSTLRTVTGEEWVRRPSPSGPTWVRVLAAPSTTAQITLTTGWVLDPPGAPPEVRIDALGQIRLSGTCKRSGATITLSGGTTTLVGTIPAEVRPAVTRNTLVLTGQGPLTLVVNPSGQVLLRSPASQTATSYSIPANTWISFDALALEV